MAKFYKAGRMFGIREFDGIMVSTVILLKFQSVVFVRITVTLMSNSPSTQTC